MSESVRTRCKTLRLAYVAEIYKKIPFENPEQYLTALLQQELELREVAKGERLIKKAKFMNEKELNDYEWSDYVRYTSQLDRYALESLLFIESNEILILTGTPDTGMMQSDTILY